MQPYAVLLFPSVVFGLVYNSHRQGPLVANILGNAISDFDQFISKQQNSAKFHMEEIERENGDQDKPVLKEEMVVDKKICKDELTVIPDPPDHKETAKMSRYLCHYSDWLSMATISTRAALTGTPFVNVFSFSDGPKGKSSGIPYFYLTGLDMSTKDLQKNNQASVTISLNQGDYCSKHKLDAEDPRCAHVILAGQVVRVTPNTTEEKFAEEALFTRHPVMPDWPDSHGFFFAKLNITNVILLDFFGGAIDVSLEEYYSTLPPL